MKKLLSTVLATVLTACCMLGCFGSAAFASGEKKSVYDISDSKAVTKTNGGEEALKLTVGGVSDLENMKWIGFKIKAAEKGEIVIGFKENSGAMYWWPDGVMHTSYLVTEDGTVTETSDKSQGKLIIPDAFTGYVVTSIADFTCHPGYAAHDADGKFTLSDLAELRFWNHKDTEWELSDVKLAATKEDFINNIVSLSEIKNVYNISALGDKAVTKTDGGEAALTLTESGNYAYESMKWIGFKLKATEKGEVVIAFKENSGAMYWWPNDVMRTSYLVTEDGTVTETSNKSQGTLVIPEAFTGYVVTSIADFTCHPGYVKHDTDGKFTLSDLAELRFWNHKDTEWEFSDVKLAKSKEDLINDVSRQEDKKVYELTASGAKAVTKTNGGEEALAFEGSGKAIFDSMKWIGFKIKATEKGEVVIAFKENSGAMYWWPNDVMRTSYLVAEDGTVTETSNKSQGTLVIPEAFTGYVVTSVEDFVCHPGYVTHDTDGKFTLSDLAELRFWNHKDTEWEFSDVKLAATKEDFIDAVTVKADGGNTGGNESGSKTAAKVVNLQDFTDISKITTRNGATVKSVDLAGGKKGLAFVPNAMSYVCMNFNVRDASELSGKDYFCFYMKVPNVKAMNMIFGLYDDAVADQRQMFWNNGTEGYKADITLITADGKVSTMAAAQKLNLKSGFEGYVIMPMSKALSLHPAYKGDGSGIDSVGITGMDIWFDMSYTDEDKEFVIADICLAEGISDYASYLGLSASVIKNIEKISGLPKTGDTAPKTLMLVIFAASLATVAVSGTYLKKQTVKR